MIYLPLFILLTYMILDNYMVSKARKKLKIVIHVNGTRGKTSVVRLLDGAFRENGYRTFSKVTGTIPMYRNCDGDEIRIKRNIVTVLEQKKMVKLAARNEAEVLIVECMALKEMVQEHAERLLRADVAVITNVRTDHLESMGLNRDEIGTTMFKMTTEHQQVIVGDQRLTDLYTKDNLIHADDYQSIEGEIKENTDIVFEVAKYYKLDTKKTIRGITKAKKDVGETRIVAYKNNDILVGFSMNDLETTSTCYQTYEPIDKKIIWFNDRADRPLRGLVFLHWLVAANPDEIILSGDRFAYNRRVLIREGYTGEIIKMSRYSDCNQCIFGMGNMKGLDFLLGGNDV